MAPPRRQRGRPAPTDAQRHGAETPAVRIIGGRFRGRKLAYHGDRCVRPMKDRVREAVFNLIGDRVAGLHGVDLFAGTGALGLEALSRGAGGATFVERHFPTAQVIEQNIATLEVQGLARVVTGDTFLWAAGAPQLPAAPWLVFCAPPYEYYHTRTAEMIALVQTFLERAPGGSLLVVEADTAFDFAQLPDAHGWRVRSYPPAVIGIYQVPDARDGAAEVTGMNGG